MNDAQGQKAELLIEMQVYPCKDDNFEHAS